MQVNRIIHPAGHGAFFTERIKEDEQKDIIVVYDCGCRETDEMRLLKKEVSGFFSPGETIDILFISHFDSDHVNGLKLLLPYMTKDTKLVMPFSYEYLYIPISSSVMMEMGNALNALHEELGDICECWVKYSDGNPEGPQGERVTDYRELKDGMIESGSRIGAVNSHSVPFRYKWIYVPFNLYDDKSYRDKFRSEVSKKMGVPVASLRPTDLDQKAIERLRNIYKSIGVHPIDTPNPKTNKANGSKNINENSLVVLSKSTTYTCELWSNTYCCIRTVPCCYRCYEDCSIDGCDGSCLYTGDSNFGSRPKVDMLRRKLHDYTDAPVNLFQLPHHGSRQYYCMSLLTDYDLFVSMFVNCGEYDFRQGSFPKLLEDATIARRNATLVTGKKICRVEQNIYMR